MDTWYFILICFYRMRLNVAVNISKTKCEMIFYINIVIQLLKFSKNLYISAKKINITRFYYTFLWMYVFIDTIIWEQ